MYLKEIAAFSIFKSYTYDELKKKFNNLSQSYRMNDLMWGLRSCIVGVRKVNNFSYR